MIDSNGNKILWCKTNDVIICPSCKTKYKLEDDIISFHFCPACGKENVIGDSVKHMIEILLDKKENHTEEEYDIAARGFMNLMYKED